MTNDVPQYVQPAPDPGIAALTEQNKQQQQAAIQDQVSASSARMMTMYGTRMAMSGVLAGSPLVPQQAPGGGIGFGAVGARA